METIIKPRRNRWVILVITLLFNLACNTDHNSMSNLYDLKAKPLYVRGSIDWISKVILIKYERNGAFDNEINRAEVSFKGVRYDSVNQETFVLIPEIDYNFDFELSFIGKEREESHKFSNILIKKYEANPFDFYKVTRYKYNSAWYEGDECSFKLE